MALLGDLDISGANALQTINQLDRGFSNLFGNLGKFGAVAVGSFAGFQILETGIQNFKEALDLGGELADMSAQTGETAGDLVILRQMFENAGLGAAGVAPFFQKLQDAIAGVNEDSKGAANALKELDVSAGELRGLSGIEQIERLQRGLEQLDQTSRVQVARDLLGGKGAKGLSLLTDTGSIAQAREQAGALATVMDRNVETFDKLGDVIGGLKNNSLEFFAGALERIAPEATSVAEALSKADFVAIGNSVGDLVAVFVKLGHVLVYIGPIADGVVSILHGLDSATESLANFVFGVSASDAARFEELQKKQSLGEKYRDFPGFEDTAKASSSIVSSLQKVGGGGGFASGADPLLDEQRRSRAVLERIAENTSPRTQSTGAPLPPPPV